MCAQKKWYRAGPAYPWVLHPWCQLMSDQIYLGEKLCRKFKKTKLEFATLCQLFTLCLHCVRHHIWSMDDLKYMEGYMLLLLLSRVSHVRLLPHRRQPTRLCQPWDSPGKNTGVGCHFLLQCMKVKSESEVAQSRPILRDPMDWSLPGSSIHEIFQARVLEWVVVGRIYIYMQIGYHFILL